MSGMVYRQGAVRSSVSKWAILGDDGGRPLFPVWPDT